MGSEELHIPWWRELVTRQERNLAKTSNQLAHLRVAVRDGKVEAQIGEDHIVHWG